MREEQRDRIRRVSTLLVRTWVGGLIAAGLLLAGFLVQDYFRGEAISHFGLGFMVLMDVVALLSLSVVLLPLLIIAVLLSRRARV